MQIGTAQAAVPTPQAFEGALVQFTPGGVPIYTSPAFPLQASRAAEATRVSSLRGWSEKVLFQNIVPDFDFEPCAMQLSSLRIPAFSGL